MRRIWACRDAKLCKIAEEGVWLLKCFESKLGCESWPQGLLTTPVLVTTAMARITVTESCRFNLSLGSGWLPCMDKRAMRIKHDHALNNCYGYGHLHAYIRAGFQDRGKMTEKTGVVWQEDDFSERREWALPIPRRMLALPIPVRRTTPRILRRSRPRSMET